MIKLLKLSTALMICQPFVCAEAATNKCTDGIRVTYANVPCEDIGLGYAGTVKNLVTVMPSISVPDRSENEDDNIPQNDTSKEQPSRNVIAKPVNPLVEKLLD